MSLPITRREALKTLGLMLGTASAASALPSRRAQAEALPHLSAGDPTAMALAYHDDAKTVAARDFPSYSPSQTCSNCLQLQGKAGDTWRACNLFPGKLVNANGWCRVWTAKS